MTRLIAAATAAALLGLAGCTSTPESADPRMARDALEEGLNAWVQGGSPSDMEKRTPPVYFNDPEWKAGKRLERFQIKGDLAPFGRQLNGSVRLSLRDKQGKTVDREVRYQIDTHNVIVIARDF